MPFGYKQKTNWYDSYFAKGMEIPDSASATCSTPLSCRQDGQRPDRPHHGGNGCEHSRRQKGDVHAHLLLRMKPVLLPPPTRLTASP